MNDKVKKHVLPNFSNFFIFWIVDKIGQAFWLFTGINMGKKVMDAINGRDLAGGVL